MTTGGPVGHLVTDRYGFGSSRDGSAGARSTGRSAPPFDRFNLGLAVGDDPDTVAGHRAALAAHIGVAPGHLVWMSQVHGTTVAQVTGAALEPLPGTDGMVTATTGIALAVLVADCVPVLAADRVAGVVGVAHAGRIGAAGGIATALIHAMTDLGAHLPDIAVLLGPAICGRCYEVPADMRDAVDSKLPGSASVTSVGTAGLDLRAGIARQLAAVGIISMELDSRCTHEDVRLFSYRRQARTGRFAAVVTTDGTDGRP